MRKEGCDQALGLVVFATMLLAAAAVPAALAVDGRVVKREHIIYSTSADHVPDAANC